MKCCAGFCLGITLLVSSIAGGVSQMTQIYYHYIFFFSFCKFQESILLCQCKARKEIKSKHTSIYFKHHNQVGGLDKKKKSCVSPCLDCDRTFLSHLIKVGSYRSQSYLDVSLIYFNHSRCVRDYIETQRKGK